MLKKQQQNLDFSYSTSSTIVYLDRVQLQEQKKFATLKLTFVNQLLLKMHDGWDYFIYFCFWQNNKKNLKTNFDTNHKNIGTSASSTRICQKWFEAIKFEEGQFFREAGTDSAG